MSSHEFWLNENFKQAYALPQDAREWLLGLWNAIQVFDDMADGDHPARPNLEQAIADLLVNMPSNKFFLNNMHVLLPLVSVAILKWIAADRVEREGEPTAMSFAWRAGYYDIVLAAVQICHGDEVARGIAHSVMALYGENFDEYLKEFKHA